ncbi:NAD-glutamate dehydrogenase domain-containing protein [Erythrobacter sp. YT30]|uniref:NAD-glutamate dehydrogenase n=1 Tax=Erythrobacter sp. YT30 TaxID=1735012 RepID=UPI00076C2F4D|nr:NAD-glutamate dehydrogenase domain-containing protein [Erythrobacter sp. YT30]KWV91510.1 glutamate dehydrogenase [Erythrobacter sp. YT30]
MAKKQAASSSEKAAKINSSAADQALLKPLKQHLAASVLPGDTPLEGDELEDVAHYLLLAGEKRTPARSTLKLQSTTGERRRLKIAVINDDMPFLVDSIASTITAHGLSIDRLVHPVIETTRNDEGQLTALAKPREDADGSLPESFIYIETPRVDARQRSELLSDLKTTLGDVRAAVSDWPKVQKAMQRDISAIGGSSPEAAALLTWLNNGMLTQLGHVTQNRDGSTAKARGICRKSAQPILSETSFDRAFQWFDDSPKDAPARDLLVIKSNRQSTVHRRIPLDLFIVPVREDGKTSSLSVHAGVWTSAALATRPQDVPVLRASLAQLTTNLGFDRTGHAGKALVHAFTALPHDLLVAFGPDDIQRLTTAMMSLVDRPRPRLVLVNSALGRHVFAFVWLPRDMLNTETRLQIEDLLTDESGASVLSWSLEVEGSTLAMLQFLLDTRETDTVPDADKIEAQLEELLRGWGDAVENELSKIEDNGRANAIATRYADAFPPAYRSDYGAKEAARDISRLRALASSGDEQSDQRDARLYRLDTDKDDVFRLKIAHIGGSLSLSDAVPAFENFGFRVITERNIALDGGSLGTIHDFTLKLANEAKIDALLDRSSIIECAIAEVLNGGSEDDPFNRLVVEAELGVREAVWLRAIYRYLRQTGMSFTIYTVVDALSAAPSVTRAMIDMFTACHDPEFDGDRDKALEEAKDAFGKGLTKVSAINDDRLLRLYRAVIEAVLRTNAFAEAANEALAFKIESEKVPYLPKPVPWREIFVYSRRVEGIHLRSGVIARGGLRWSDRRDDFRTEVLGLMKAQRVKNAVIVPTGAKGGFYPKQLPNPSQDRDAWAKEGKESYKVFIRSLLSVTDNLKGNKVVHPEDVVIHDGEDPYFVVAADKGTASFSDVANGIAEDKNFWLGDAFASGGSNGYDHKAMGITARGAWVSVQRHFLEMGIDVQEDTIEVVGCGDMSGDVFGNGMLLSKAIKLVAAYDHRHIFIDPSPDPAASWKERKRLFEKSSSSWDEYDKDLISRGGGVYSRDAKNITLSKTAASMLGLECEEITPDNLVSAILRAPVDLIWFGGIGTYIKSEDESNSDVGDRANDALRINARQVGAKVIGEGANLGITQAGRIEFALNGGRLNADFIDNSAGVDCSDNEVNIKIALASAVRGGDLTEKKRNNLLQKMTDEVAEIVLEDNRLQALALSIAEAAGAKAMDSYIRLIERLEEMGVLDRENQGIADNEMLKRRANDGKGLTRPELAVLLSTTKLVLQDAIEESDLPDDPSLEDDLINMFPEPMRKDFKGAITDHRLRRELIATELANRIVNSMGPLAVFELAEEEGAMLEAIAKTFVAVDTLFDMRGLWTQIDDAKVSEATRIELFERTGQALGAHMGDLLRAGAARQRASELAEELAPGINELTKATETLISGDARQQSDNMRGELTDAGTPKELAGQIVRLFEMDGAAGLARLAQTSGLPITDLTSAFTDLGARLGLDWAQRTAALMEPSDVWERMLVAGLARDFQQMRLDLLRALLKKKDAEPKSAVDKWADDNSASIRQFRNVVARAQNQTPVAPAVLAQIASQARGVLEA